MRKNSKTTIGGILAAVGSFLVNSQTGVLNVIGQICQVVGIFLIGAMAQDAVSTKTEA
jgi:mannose/fructose/N-acetylgalactosamine-specific phosphotransferase system component IID